jgi:hypothetical protein
MRHMHWIACIKAPVDGSVATMFLGEGINLLIEAGAAFGDSHPRRIQLSPAYTPTIVQ